MSKHKEQHYVPRVYLRQFSPDSNRKTVGVWIPNTDKIAVGAPIKSQCADPYFYGRDLVVEGLLNQPEGWYGSLIREITEGGRTDQAAADQLIFFWLLQHVRSKVSISESQRMSEDMRQAVFEGQESRLDASWSEPLSLEVAAKINLEIVGDVLPMVSDLRAVILENATSVCFLTCDNPAVLQNKFFSLGRQRTRTYGLGHAGVYIYMPLSPRLAFLAYDAGIYHFPRLAGSKYLVQEEDVHCLNSAIMAQAESCIYFRDLTSAHSAIQGIKRRASLIVKPESRFTLAALESMVSGGGVEKYAVGNLEAFRKASKGLMHSEKLLACIPKHLPSMRLRNNKKYFDTRSRAGLLRHPRS